MRGGKVQQSNGTGFVSQVQGCRWPGCRRPNTLPESDGPDLVRHVLRGNETNYCRRCMHMYRTVPQWKVWSQSCLHRLPCWEILCSRRCTRFSGLRRLSSWDMVKYIGCLLVDTVCEMPGGKTGESQWTSHGRKRVCGLHGRRELPRSDGPGKLHSCRMSEGPVCLFRDSGSHQSLGLFQLSGRDVRCCQWFDQP